MTVIVKLYKDETTPNLATVQRHLQDMGYAEDTVALTLLACAHDSTTFTLWISSAGQVCLLLTGLPIHMARLEIASMGESTRPAFYKIMALALDERFRTIESVEASIPFLSHDVFAGLLSNGLPPALKQRLLNVRQSHIARVSQAAQEEASAVILPFAAQYDQDYMGFHHGIQDVNWMPSEPWNDTWTADGLAAGGYEWGGIDPWSND